MLNFSYRTGHYFAYYISPENQNVDNILSWRFSSAEIVWIYLAEYYLVLVIIVEWFSLQWDSNKGSPVRYTHTGALSYWAIWQIDTGVKIAE